MKIKFNNIEMSSLHKCWIAFVLLFLLIFLIYSNTFHAAWHFDDYPNIVHNPNLHIQNLNTESLIQTLFAYPNGQGNKMYRPVACVTFAINWYFGKERVYGYHLVNILIHFITSFILFLAVQNLLKTPNVKEISIGNKYFISLLTAILWAVHPIQTQAVTYIVQRMASLAAMFYILGIYFFLKYRFSDLYIKRVYLLSGCIVSFILALGSKENTITFPMALILIEIIFFQDMKQQRTRRIIAGSVFICLLTVILITFQISSPLSFFEAYANRPYTLSQRLMTEARIIVFYISLLFYPAASRFSLVHDVEISTALYKPLMTFPSLIFIFLLICFGLFHIRKRPVISFAVLFFFLNHLTESTFIPLELIYEHRNYLPSLFVFMPVATGIKYFLDHYSEKNRFIYQMSLIFGLLILTGVAFGTYSRNMVWSTEKTLWEDSMAKAPGLARPPHNLAYDYYEKIGDYDKALELYKKAVQLKNLKPEHAGNSHNNIGNIYYQRKQYDKAIEYFNQALLLNHEYDTARYNLTLALIQSGKWGEALEEIDLLISKNYDNETYLNLKGFILLKQYRPVEAVPYFRQVLENNSNNTNGIFYLGVAFCLAGEYDKARFVLEKANHIMPDNIFVYLYLIENSLQSHNLISFEQNLEKLFSEFSIEKIKSILEYPNDNLSVSFSYNLLIKIKEKIDVIDKE